MARAPRPLPPPHRRLSLIGGIALTGLAIGAVMLFVPDWMARQEIKRQADAAEAEAQAVLAEYRKGLPREHAPGLVFEAVTLEGPRLVMVIRSKGRTAAEALANPQIIEATRRGEQALMLGFCNDRAVVAMLARGLVFTRRFVGSDRQPLFEVSLTGADCVARR